MLMTDTLPTRISHPRPHPHPQRRAVDAVHGVDRAAIDARVIALFDNASLRSQVRKLDKVELSSV